MARQKSKGVFAQWRENNRRGDGKPGGCGHWFSEVRGGRDVCSRCSRDLGPADQK